MTPTPLVSIVTPAYNQAQYLAATIESVLAQDYPNVEYLVLDDGSTDETASVVATFGARIRSERHDNMGQAQTLNKGWSMCRGEVLAYLSSDDLLLPTAVSEAVAALAANRRVVVTYCDFDLVDSEGRPFRPVLTEDFVERRLTEDLVCQPGPGAFFRRSAFEKSGGWRAHLRQTPDFDFWLRMVSQGDFMRIPKRLAHYRVHEESASFKPISEARANEIVDVVREHWASREKACPPAALAKALVLSSKLHLRSGRAREGLKRFVQAVALAPSVALGPESLRPIMSGLFRRSIHRFRGRK